VLNEKSACVDVCQLLKSNIIQTFLGL